MDDIFVKAINLIENNNARNVYELKYSSIYMFATENLKGVMNTIDVSNKKVLTVSSSGDHIFNMLLNGTNHIEAYDINYFTKYYFYFKASAICSLGYTEFLDFFFSKTFSFNSKSFADEVFFNKILPNIKDKETQFFWKALFDSYGGQVLYKSNLFIPNGYSKKTYIKCNDYLSDEANYKIVQQRLATYDYKFYNINIFGDISTLSDNKYDVIYLSNILDRLTSKNELECAIKLKDVIKKLKEHLTENGLLSLCYLYCYLDDSLESNYPGNITNIPFRYKYFPNYIYSPFNGFIDLKGRMIKNSDALMLTRKKND